MDNKELLQQTIEDLQETRDTISERHKDNPTLTLRIGSVFNQLINSLGVHVGAVVSPTVVSGAWKPEPLNKVLGKDISTTPKRDLKPIEVDDVAAFKEKMQTIYDNFLNRENADLKDALEEVEMRGVAKMAGVDTWETQKVDGNFINKIKKAIESKAKLSADQEAAKAKLNEGAADLGASGAGAAADVTNTKENSADQEAAKA